VKLVLSPSLSRGVFDSGMAAPTMGYRHDRREIATPLCGAHRENHSNPLLVKPMLGCVKQTCYDLPSKGNLQHPYGLPQERDGTTSHDVIGNWAQHDPNAKVKAGRDFKMLNKHAVVDGKSTPKQIAEYRKTHDFRLPLGSDKPLEKKNWDQTTSFGRTTNTSENFNDLISHGYRYDWVAEAPPAAEMNAARKPQKPAMTKSAIAVAKASREKMADPPKADLWKIKGFANTPAKIGPQG